MCVFMCEWTSVHDTKWDFKIVFLPSNINRHMWICKYSTEYSVYLMSTVELCSSLKDFHDEENKQMNINKNVIY